MPVPETLTADHKRRINVIKDYHRKLGYSIAALERGELSLAHFNNIAELQAGYLYDGVQGLKRSQKED
jgi:hypothetical protein